MTDYIVISRLFIVSVENLHRIFSVPSPAAQIAFSFFFLTFSHFLVGNLILAENARPN